MEAISVACAVVSNASMTLSMLSWLDTVLSSLGMLSGSVMHQESLPFAEVFGNTRGGISLHSPTKRATRWRLSVGRSFSSAPLSLNPPSRYSPSYPNKLGFIEQLQKKGRIRMPRLGSTAAHGDVLQKKRASGCGIRAP
jgi:hypothetical protein